MCNQTWPAGLYKSVPSETALSIIQLKYDVKVHCGIIDLPIKQKWSTNQFAVSNNVLIAEAWLHKCYVAYTSLLISIINKHFL